MPGAAGPELGAGRNLNNSLGFGNRNPALARFGGFNRGNLGINPYATAGLANRQGWMHGYWNGNHPGNAPWNHNYYGGWGGYRPYGYGGYGGTAGVSAVLVSASEWALAWEPSVLALAVLAMALAVLAMGWVVLAMAGTAAMAATAAGAIPAMVMAAMDLRDQVSEWAEAAGD